MSTIATTIIIKCKDSLELPLNALVVIVKNIFKYGVKEIKVKNNLVVVSLCYSPKETTLKKKFGNLPVSYVRVNADNDEELTLFEQACRRFQFNLSDSDTEEEKQPKQLDSKKPAKMRKNNLQILAKAAEAVSPIQTQSPSLLESPVRPYRKRSIAPLKRELQPSPIVEEEEDLGMESQQFF